MAMRVNWMPPRNKTISPDSFERGFQSAEAAERRQFEQQEAEEGRDLQRELMQDQQEFEKELAQMQASLELPLYKQLQRRAQAAREAGNLEEANKLMADADKSRKRAIEAQESFSEAQGAGATRGDIKAQQKLGLTPAQESQRELSQEDLRLQEQGNRIKRQDVKNRQEYYKMQNEIAKDRLDFRKWTSEMERMQAKVEAQDKLIMEAPEQIQTAYGNTLKSLKTLYGDQLPEKVSVSDFGALRSRIEMINKMFSRHGMNRQFKLAFETPKKDGKGVLTRASEWFWGKDVDKDKVKLGMPVIKYRDSGKEPWKALTTEQFAPEGTEAPRGYPGTAPGAGTAEEDRDFEYQPFPDHNRW